MTAIAARIDRSTVAGLGASGALMAAVTVVAVFLAAVVAFDGWPGSGGGDQPTAVNVEPAAAAPSRAAAAALAPGAGAVAATPAPVVLASAGDPNSVITPGLPGPTQGTGGSQPGTGGGGGGGINTPGPGQTVTGPLNNPLVTSVGTTVDQTLNGVVGVVCSPGTQLVNGLCRVVDSTVNNTSGTVNGLLNGLLGGSQTQP
jgi:hypothetical protein